MLTHTIFAALGPITLGVFLGWISGKTEFIKKEYAQAFADFVVKIALPLALFLAALSSSPKNILNIDYALAMGSGLIITYLIGYVYGRYYLKYDTPNATMQALTVSFPDMAYCGPPHSNCGCWLCRHDCRCDWQPYLYCYHLAYCLGHIAVTSPYKPLKSTG